MDASLSENRGDAAGSLFTANKVDALTNGQFVAGAQVDEGGKGSKIGQR